MSVSIPSLGGGLFVNPGDSSARLRATLCGGSEAGEPLGRRRPTSHDAGGGMRPHG
jgi:hypothetical protein